MLVALLQLVLVALNPRTRKNKYLAGEALTQGLAFLLPYALLALVARSVYYYRLNTGADPRLVSNHFSDPRDLQACLDALRLLRRTAQAAPLARWLEGEERPGPKAASDESLVAYLRATGATAYHPVGSCRIGTDPAQSVVDPELRVHGIDGLRVADASVMPTIAATNTNAICVVIGERVADFVRKRSG